MTDETARLLADTRAFLETNPPAVATEEDRLAHLEARFDAGLAAVHYPEGLGGRGLPRPLQSVVDDALAVAGSPDNRPTRNVVNLGMAGPTILEAGTQEQKDQFMRPLWTGRHVWCQLFSEPGAGSDLAGLATKAVRDGDDWVVTGQKVWTTLAHLADYAILVARTDPSVPKHRGITYFLLDMKSPGVTVRPLRQITGEAEFNEVFLDEVRIPDSMRLGPEGAGWKLATVTLSNERSGSGTEPPRESGAPGNLFRAWRELPAAERESGLRDEVVRAWIRSEAIRLTQRDVGIRMAASDPPPEASALKLAKAENSKQTASLLMQALGERALEHADGYAFTRPEEMNFDVGGLSPSYSYLRTRANSIEGGTSEVLRTVIGERILGLPREPRGDIDVPFSEVPR
ncbi:acyl-CoA dehydrogenase family protein [Brevibacterium yomogidense]|uniref:acyl-CoA dehydrogenase family protein n=1 Tax=Brevibacterium yomogidense TaxID=946573 RepID=UPI0018DF1B11|nr:acyl-CoA dehydrogenase family protein [Brevibacterium yomogidense]